LLSGIIKYELFKGNNNIGNKNSQNTKIILNNLGIAEKHWNIIFDSDKKTAKLIPNNEPLKNKVFVNGKLLVDPFELSHMDRIWFGNNWFFQYIDSNK